MANNTKVIHIGGGETQKKIFEQCKKGFYDRIRDEFLEPAGLINNELSFGCEVKYDSPQGGRYTGMVQFVDKVHKNVCVNFLERKYKEVEILGHPYDLREVMRWFELNGKGGIRSDGTLYSYWSDRNVDEYEDELGCVISLEKPLRDQDLEPLYNVMKSLSGSVNQK